MAPPREASDARAAPRWRLFRRLARFLRFPLVGYLLLVLIMLFLENSLIFYPSVYPNGIWKPPGLAFEDAWFRASDGTKLHGWYVPHPDPRAVVLFAHGNAGNLSHRWDVVQDLSGPLGASVMIFDYRGFGRSEGKPSEQGVLDDARAARRWLAERAGVDESHVVLMGESIGGGVMVDLAAGDGARGLVLENTFSSLPEVAAYHFPWLPVKLLMRTRLDSAAKIRDYRGPLLQFHGDADTIVPFKLGQRLFDAANEPKQLVVIPGGDHNDPRTAAFHRAVDAFLARLEDDD
jgi:fermentation-respiration switch protein FrsA (DUF1100 family)